MSEKHAHRDCSHLLAGLSAYIDGEAEAALCAEIEQHLAACENCRVVVDTLRRTVLLYREEQPAPLPEGGEAAPVQSVRTG
ncbi:MAG: zf-HC2 domain-containing protein [Anaerolineae bacterium]|nr:zf-HC2 domain-containing protein [Anaerolineae bacterium]